MNHRFAIRRPGWALAINSQMPGAIDGLAVDIQPCANIEEYFLHLVRNGAVGARPDVQ